jgi:hypothetical protein
VALALPPVDDKNETFVREVDDELRRDDLTSIWNRFGKPAVAAIVVALLAWGGWLFWQNRAGQQAGLDSEQLVTVGDTIIAGNDLGADAKLALLAKSDNQAMVATAELTRAAVALGKNDSKKAIGIYQKVSADNSAPQPLRDLAVIRLVALEMDTAKPEATIARLKPYAVVGNPWFGSAGEMSAIAYLKMGKPDLAGKMLADVAKDEDVPDTIRSRAVQLANALGAEASIKPTGEEPK